MIWYFHSTEELRQAVVAMMVRKDEVEDQNRSLQALLEQEMEVSSMLRADIQDLKQETLSQQEQDLSKINKLQKYVTFILKLNITLFFIEWQFLWIRAFGRTKIRKKE